MKLKLAALGLILTLLTVALWVANERRKETPAYLLKQYPQSDTLRMIIKDRSQPPVPLAIAVFFTDWFDSNATDPSTGCNVTTAGKTCGVWSANSSFPSTTGDTTKAQLAAFDKIAPTLPPSQLNPTLPNLLIVSFKRNGHWTTRIYDRSNLPPQVVKAHQILGIKGFDRPPKSATE